MLTAPLVRQRGAKKVVRRSVTRSGPNPMVHAIDPVAGTTRKLSQDSIDDRRPDPSLPLNRSRGAAARGMTVLMASFAIVALRRQRGCLPRRQLLSLHNKRALLLLQQRPQSTP